MLKINELKVETQSPTYQELIDKLMNDISTGKRIMRITKNTNMKDVLKPGITVIDDISIIPEPAKRIM